MAFAAVGAAVGAIASGASAYGKIKAQNAELTYQSQQAAQNAAAYRAAAERDKILARAAEENITIAKQEATRRFSETQGSNVALMAASGLAVASGSAAETLEGNAKLYAEDVGTLDFQRRIARWEANENFKNTMWQASVQDTNSRYYLSRRTSAAGTLFSVGLSALSGGLSTYTALGGGFGFAPSTAPVTSGMRGAGTTVSTYKATGFV